MRNAKCEMRKKMKNEELQKLLKFYFEDCQGRNALPPSSVRAVGEHIEKKKIETIIKHVSLNVCNELYV